MKQVTLNIPDSKYQFFIELINHLGFDKPAELPIPEWQKNIVRDRIKNSKPEEYLSWDEAEKKIKFD